MSVNIIIQPHPLRSSRIKITAQPNTIKKIIENLNTGFPLSQARVCRNGEIVTDFSEYALSGDNLTIKFVPCGTPEEAGAGMKLGGWALVMLGAIISIASFGTLSGLGVAMIGTGLGLALGGQVLMSTQIPVTDREKPENDPSIRGGKNQARQHGRIPVLFGRHRIFPDLAANPHTEIIGNQQYFIQMFCGGYKDCVIDLNSIKLGETPIIEYSKTKNINEIMQGLDPVIKMEILQNGEQSSIYPYCVHEDALNAPLQNEVDDGEGGKISGEIISRTPNNTNKINVDIFLHNGIGKYKDSGGLDNASVDVEISFKNVNDNNYQLMELLNITGAELKTKRYQVTRDNLPPGQYEVKITRLSPDSTDSKIVDQVYVGSVRSYKTKDKDGKPIRPIRRQRQENLTIITLRVMATAKLNNVIDGFNYVATSKLPVYDKKGSGPLYWSHSEETRNPASALIYALQGRAAQQIVDSDDVDYPSIEKFYAWCEEHDYTCNAYLSESVTIAELLKMIGSTARADILRIDSKISVVQDIERPAHMQLFTPKNSISYSISMFNADVPEAISMQFIDEESGYAQNDCLVYNTKDGNKIEDPKTIQKCGLWGVTNSIQARRLGMYNYGCIKNRPFIHTIEADIEYLVVSKGDWIQYAGDVALTGSVQGRIKGTIWADGVCVGIDTDEPVAMTAGNHYAVRIRLRDGTIILKDAVFNQGLRREKSVTYYPGENEKLFEPFIGDIYAIDEKEDVYYEPENIIYFIEPLDKNTVLKAGDIYAFGVRGYEALDLIITDIQPGNNFTATLTCVEYSPEIFDVDKPNFILPDFINRITPVSGAIDPGTVTPDNWLRFAVYHDSEEEPALPSGNGQTDGWYLAQTFRSLWQSVKIAQSIESGAWGSPVRIKAQRGLDDVTPIWLS
ncbi:MAG: host specificity factor TipJ family phage tail protein, partial [Treponema sp.]|nr:host specificity factor TipJ family phage tail protein [Treponema sp.]